MSPEVKAAIEQCCKELTDHDPWMNREMCERILQDVDFEAPGQLTRDGEYYEIVASHKDGRELKMGYIWGGWYLNFGVPEKTGATI